VRPAIEIRLSLARPSPEGPFARRKPVVSVRRSGHPKILNSRHASLGQKPSRKRKRKVKTNQEIRTSSGPLDEHVSHLDSSAAVLEKNQLIVRDFGDPDGLLCVGGPTGPVYGNRAHPGFRLRLRRPECQVQVTRCTTEVGGSFLQVVQK